MKKQQKKSLSFEFFKKRVRVSVIVVTLLLGALLLLISYSYAFYTIFYEKKNALTLTAGSISYTLTSGSMNERQEVTVGANSMLTFTVNLKSNNEIDSLYQLYYSGTLPSGVTISYKTSVPDGVIEKGATEVIVLAIENTNSSSKTITIGVQGGLLDKPLEQEANTTSIKGLYQAKKPTITLNTTTVTINAGDSYQVMTGVSAKDPYGKDITSKISYSPTSWDNHTIGTTKITYQVTDDYGQSASSTRSITVNRVYVYNYESDHLVTNGWEQFFKTCDSASFYQGGYHKANFIYDYGGTTDDLIMNGMVKSSLLATERSIVSLATNYMIDLSKYKRLAFRHDVKNLTTTGELGAHVGIGCFKSVNNINHAEPVVGTELTGKGTTPGYYYFDVSNINTSCYLGFYIFSEAIDDNTTWYVSISRVWLE